MRLSVLTLTLLCLLSVACSTTPARPLSNPTVVSPDPPGPLLELCLPPYLVPAQTSRDLVANSNNRQSAFDACAIRQRCLVEWLQRAKAPLGPVVKPEEGCGEFIAPLAPDGVR